MNDNSKLGNKLCFVNLIFKNGYTDSIAVNDTKEDLWNDFIKNVKKFENDTKTRVLIIYGIDGNVYVDMSTVAKLEISTKDKGPFVTVYSKLNKDFEL